MDITYVRIHKTNAVSKIFPAPLKEILSNSLFTEAHFLILNWC